MIKVTDNIFQNCTFPVEAYRSTEHCWWPSRYASQTLMSHHQR